MWMLVSSACVFASVVMAGVTLWPDLSQRMIRQRVLTEIMPAEHRSTMLTYLSGAIDPLMRRLPLGGYQGHLGQRLGAAGMRMTALEFIALQCLGLAAGALLYGLTVGWQRLSLGWMAVFLGMGVGVPWVWLTNQIQARRQSVARDLPEVVDLLNLCVDAGLDFMNAMARIVQEFRLCPTTKELALVLQEVRVGKRRRDALRAFSARLQTPETSSFVRTLVQADRMGTGMGEALSLLSEDMRLHRSHWADRFAQQAPLKMLLPLIMSLAAALMIVAGPILLQFLRGGFSAAQFTSAQSPRQQEPQPEQPNFE